MKMPPRAFNDFKTCLSSAGVLNKVTLLDDFEGKEKLVENINYFLDSQDLIFQE